jgi:DNA invertase Pin-like site-specific DNA recombinase
MLEPTRTVKRQRAAIEAFAKSAGYEIVDSYYDEAVSGADHVATRLGFAAMMERIASNGVQTTIVETAGIVSKGHRSGPATL